MPLSKKARRSSEQPSAAADAICVFVNAGRIDFDRALDLSALESCSRVVRHEGDPASEDELVARVADSGASVVVTKEIPVPASAVERFPSSVRLIVEAGTGYNNIPLPAVKARDITVCNIPAYSSDSVAHLVITFALNWSCGLLAQQRALLASDRSNFEVGALLPPHFELGGKTIGLIGGSGDIGSKVCAIARALGMHVLISSRSPPACMISWRSPPASGEEGVEYTASVDDLLRRSDIVSLHCPLNAETRRLIDARALGLMKRDGYLINTGRGGLVDEAALISALRDGTIGGAALDVQDPEPPVQSSPLYKLPNVCLTPHIGWKRKETRQRLVGLIAGNVQAFLAGAPINVVGGK